MQFGRITSIKDDKVVYSNQKHSKVYRLKRGHAAVVYINREHMKVYRFVRSEFIDSYLDDPEDFYLRNSVVFIDEECARIRFQSAE